MYESEDLNQGLYFLDDAILSAGKTLSIVSTFIWERLPRNSRIPALMELGGWRALGPYLLYAFGMIALGQRLDIEYHPVSRGCPLDYNLDVFDIDRFFMGGKFCADCEKEIERVTKYNSNLKEEFDAIKILLNVAAGRPPMYKYKFALSFSGMNRPVAQRLATLLGSAGLSVFYDDHNPQDLVGKDLGEYFQKVFGRESEYCVILVSQAYVQGPWTTHERRVAQQRARKERDKEYILPVMIEDGVELPGMSGDVGYLSLSGRPIEEIAQILVRKARE
ncbi:MAG: toll/interleukin-1 receptor domain-containing protein [Bdellovibrionota bacterium]